MTLESKAADYLRQAKLIIYDEATMSDKYTYECIDSLLRDIHDNDLPFGGVVVLFGKFP